MKHILLILICTVGLAASASDAGDAIVRLATTTSTYETGLLDHILPPFEKQNSVKVHVISVGTGKAIKIAENGDVDAILVHARQEEDEFVEAGFGVGRKDVMHNDFVILGPKTDPAGIKGSKDTKKALLAISKGKYIFISRGDDSGTHKKEKSLWSKAGISPKGEWYLEAGQGMSATLRMADEKNGYVMVDRATYLSFRDKLRLGVVVEGDKELFNPYGIIAVSPRKHEHVEHDMAMALIRWITSVECQKMIASYKRAGTQLFYPDALPLDQEP